MKIIVLFLVVTFICLYEVPKMKKQKMKKELLLFSAILSLATVVAFLKLRGVDIPNPLQGLEYIISPIGSGIEVFFKGKGDISP